ncbi:O-acetylserine/cysteine exporter [Oceanisphaera profunda]|uniref:O-acetylserine/cysteine exporter n=1 Tax=Oceanisphaera profunda TaxID=1416627 RepID=A0A1Y0D4R3_9GAMM|nr:EamA family transporter [Oceanisphaera profunda]ART82531.1 O-acetylserine/cysteine exporter [Oceanisphaera profunda]
MAPKDVLLALVVIGVWGMNFVVILAGLDDVPPMLLGALRFTLVAFPAVLLVKRPAVPWRWLIAYGGTISLGQFAFLFYAMANGMPAGLASLVLQSQAFFSLFFAALLLGEKIKPVHLAGLLVAAVGLAIIGFGGDGTMTMLGLGLTLAASAMWALGNIVTKKIGRVNLIGLIVWGNLVPPLPFLALSFWLEGPAQIAEALRHISSQTLLALAYLAFIATLLGYGLWSRLLQRYATGMVAPFSLLVPVVGLSSAVWLLDEQLTTAQWAGALLVMLGLGLNVFGLRVWNLLSGKDKCLVKR